MRPIIVCLVAVLFGPIPCWADPAAESVASLQTQIDQALRNHGQQKVDMGARVVELSTGRILYDYDGHVPLIPASNMKLVVMATALDELGPAYKIQTVLALRGVDLIVIGGGDPTIGDEKLAGARNETITTLFEQWARKLKGAGIRQIPGEILIDDSLFDSEFVHPNWPPDQFQKWYEAPVGGLIFNASCTAVQVAPSVQGRPAIVSPIPAQSLVEIVNKTTTAQKDTATVRRAHGSATLIVQGGVARKGVLGPVAVQDPGVYFGDVLKSVLIREGIPVHGGVKRERVRFKDGTLPRECHVIAVHRTPICDALQRAGKDSLGVAAEAIAKLVGSQGEGGVGSWKSARFAVRRFLTKAGVPEEQVRIDDGSGLSRGNRVSAAAMTQVLQYMYRSEGEAFNVLKDSLACAGVDGTLKKRMREAPTLSKVFAKTGYINGVRTLAGYVETPSGEMLAFAFFYNNAAKTRPLTQAQDAACRILATWSRGADARQALSNAEP